MMKRRNAILKSLILTALTAGAASAQTGRVALEGRGGFTLPQNSLKADGASSGFSAGLDVMYNFLSHFTGYAGVSRDEFDGDFSSKGMQAGLKVVPLDLGSVLPWVSAGAIGQKMNAGGANSDLGLGLEAGGGADFEVTPQFTIAPGVRYRTYTAGFDVGEINAHYLTVMLGAHLHLR
jgi:hypothetical protein